MPTPPPIPTAPARLPPAMPPPLPTALVVTPDVYLNRCTLVCLIAAGFVALGGTLVAIEDPHRFDKDKAPALFALGWILCAVLAGVFLRKRSRLGHPLASIIFATMLIGLPVGTVVGVLGFTWLKKGQALLR